LIDEKDY